MTVPRLKIATSLFKSIGSMLAFAFLLSWNAFASDYYWKSADGNYHAWIDSGIWATDSSGTVSETSPGDEDTIANTSTAQAMYLNLGGSSASIGNWKWDTANKLHSVKLTNGTLNVTGTRMSVNSGSFTIESGGVLNIGANVVWLGGGTENGNNQANNPFEYIVKDGGQLLFHGRIRSEWMTFTIEHGGYFCFASDAVYGNGNRQKENVYNIYGTLDFPNGVQKFNDSWSVWPVFNLCEGGVMISGNGFKKGSNWQHQANFMGGEFRATGNVSFQLKTNGGVFKAGYDTTLNVVSANNTLDLSNFIYEEGATAVTRTGAGTLLLPDVPYSLDLQDGTTTFSANTRTAMGALKVAAGQSFTLPHACMTVEYVSNAGTITLGAPGISIGGIAVGGSVANGTFVLNGAAFSEGDTIVTTPDATLRAKIKADLEAVGVNVAESGNTLTIGASELIFNGGAGGAITDINDATAWKSGSIPPAGATVMIASNVTAEITAEGTDIPAWALIIVQDGATLRVSKATALPSIQLEGAASFEIVAGSSTMANGFATVADGAKVPSLSVADGGTLYVPGGTTFGGLSLSVAGTLAATSSGDIVLGYARAGETNAFALAVTGGVVSNQFGDINFVCPASGGTVTVSTALVLTNATLKTGSAYAYNFGINNPETQTVNITFNDMTLHYPDSGSWATVPKIIGGGVKMAFTNGASLYRGNGETRAELTIRESAQLIFNEGCSFKFGHSQNAAGSSGNGKVTIDPSDGVASIILNDGATMDIYREDGKSKAVLEVHGTAVREKGYAGWNVEYPFKNYEAVDLADADSVLKLAWSSSYSEGWVDDYLKVKAKNLVIDSVPFTGLGSLVIDNSHLSAAKTMTLRGVSTATGSLSVVPEKNVRLILDDGFGWAGTVAAGDVILTNKTTAAYPATVTFGALDLRADFPLRVWKENGVVSTNDMLNVGTYLNNGGKLVPTIVGEGEFVVDDSFCVGTIGRGGTLPRLPAGWYAKRTAIDGDEVHDLLTLKRGVGLQVIVR